MKKVLLFLFIGFLFNCVNKSEKHKLVVHIKYCKIEHKEVFFIPELELYQNENLINKYKPEILNDYFTIDSLNSRNYTIKYPTMYKMTESINFSLNKKKNDTIVVCLDKINYDSVNHLPFIEKIKRNEEFSINVTTIGCVSFGGTEMKIKKLNDGIYATRYDKEKKLSQNEIELIRRFELELVNMDNGGCSYTDIYTLKYNENELIINDGSCNWYGFSRLLEAIFKEDT